MSTLQKFNFELTTDNLPVQKKDFALADPTLCQPLNAVCLIDGEWMTLNAAYQLIRATDILTLGAYQPAGASFVPRSFALWAEKGRTDVQAMSGHKMPLLWRGEYEANTRIFDAAVSIHGGAPITAPFQPLKVATIGFSGRYYTGLVGHGGLTSGDVDPIVGWVTMLPAINGGRLRFISGGRV